MALNKQMAELQRKILGGSDTEKPQAEAEAAKYSCVSAWVTVVPQVGEADRQVRGQGEEAVQGFQGSGGDKVTAST